MPPFARAVELRQGDAGDVDRLAEEPRLLEAVLARGRVDDEQRLVRRALEPLRDHAAHLRELLHQVRLRVQPAGRVDDHDVAAARLGGRDRVERDRGRVAAALGADEVRARALGPDLELLLGRRAERVRGGEDDRAPVLARGGCASLPIVVVLPVPLTPTTRMTAGRALEREPRLPGRRDELRDDLLERRSGAPRASPAALLEPPDDLGRRRHAARRRAISASSSRSHDSSSAGSKTRA